jgi:hypothetical protein
MRRPGRSTVFLDKRDLFTAAVSWNPQHDVHPRAIDTV